MVKKVTSFTAHQTAEGMRIAFTYSLINDNGETITQNKRASFILLDDSILSNVDVINDYLYTRIPEE